MQDPGKSKGKSFSAFRSAAEEVGKRVTDEAESEKPARGKEGGHMSSTAGRVTHAHGSELPYLAILNHHDRDPTEHGFATMREAEAFIKRNTPVPGGSLSDLYDRPAGD